MGLLSTAWPYLRYNRQGYPQDIVKLTFGHCYEGVPPSRSLHGRISDKMKIR